MKEIKVKYIDDVPENYTGVALHPNECKFFFKDGKLHNENGPAVVFADGTKIWYKNGKSHNDSGPAVVWYDGSKAWCQNGKRHREDGPAVIWPDGSKFWYLNGKELTEAAFKIRTCKLIEVLNESV